MLRMRLYIIKQKSKGIWMLKKLKTQYTVKVGVTNRYAYDVNHK